MSRTVVLVALPGVALAAAGLTHPHHLTADTARWWTLLHVTGLFVFPLVGAAFAWLVRGRSDVESWVVRGSAYLYATAYTALDVISGATAGWLTFKAGDAPRSEQVNQVFRLGNAIGELGALALVACTVVLAGGALVRYRVAALPTLALVLGAYLVHENHIYAPWGSFGMLLIGLATGWLAHLQDGAGAGRSASTRS